VVSLQLSSLTRRPASTLPSCASRLSDLNTAAYQRLYSSAHLIMSHDHSSTAMVMGASECQMEVC